jgi:hypothetical protein
VSEVLVNTFLTACSIVAAALVLAGAACGLCRMIRDLRAMAASDAEHWEGR